MLVSPSSPIPIPKDIEKARTAALNSVTQSEAEYRRLVEMQISKEMEIVELVKKKIYEEEQFEKVSKELILVVEKVKQATSEEASLMAKIALQREEIAKSDKDIKEKEKKCSEREKDIDDRTNILRANENQYLVKRDELQDAIIAHNLRVDILTKAIKSCSIQA